MKNIDKKNIFIFIIFDNANAHFFNVNKYEIIEDIVN